MNDLKLNGLFNNKISIYRFLIYVFSLFLQFEEDIINIYMKLNFAFISKEKIPKEVYQQYFVYLSNGRHKNCVQIYSDASVFQNKGGRAAAAALIPNTAGASRVEKLPNGTSVEDAEMHGLFLGAHLAANSAEKGNNKFVIYCDSYSAIKKFWPGEGTTNDIFIKTKELLLSLVKQGNIIELCWIPGHVNIDGNARADRLAKHEATK